ncbi:MAG: helix-turn-helix domain-containing protein [Pseudomonadota bacterium]|jgi:AraC family transcriptional activator of pobA|nr:helix-turn-helix domain-containing protein [Pseudomonadota bacterium]
MKTSSPPPKPAPAAPPSAKQSRRPAAAIPSFALYGESATPGQEVLHIEEVESRSRLNRWEIEPHVHHGLYQVLWVLQGSAEVVLDEWREAAHGPAAIVVPPGVVHGFRFAPDTDGLVLTFSARLLVEGEFQSVGEAFRALFTAPGVLQFAPEDGAAARLDALFRELAAEFALPGTAESPVASWLARAVVWRLAQASAQGRQAQGERAHRHQALFTRFLLLVEQHFLAHWPLERYASRLGLSTQRLNRLVRAESGRSALELVHERLTREACRRLVYTAAPAASLAAELGFDDPAYFSRFFKRRTSLSPQRYRQAHRAQD